MLNETLCLSGTGSHWTTCRLMVCRSLPRAVDGTKRPAHSLHNNSALSFGTPRWSPPFARMDLFCHPVSHQVSGLLSQSSLLLSQQVSFRTGKLMLVPRFGLVWRGTVGRIHIQRH